MGKLYFELEQRPSPYLNHSTLEDEVWGQVTIIASNSKETELLVWQWNLRLLETWFNTNRVALLSELLSIQGYSPLPGESLAQALIRFQYRDFTPQSEKLEEIWFNSLFEYHQRHSLRFAFRGADIPDIIIGLNHGTGEISTVSERAEWSYKFDIRDFCDNLQKRLELIFKL